MIPCGKHGVNFIANVDKHPPAKLLKTRMNNGFVCIFFLLFLIKRCIIEV